MVIIIINIVCVITFVASLVAAAVDFDAVMISLNATGLVAPLVLLGLAYHRDEYRT